MRKTQPTVAPPAGLFNAVIIDGYTSEKDRVLEFELPVDDKGDIAAGEGEGGRDDRSAVRAASSREATPFRDIGERAGERSHFSELPFAFSLAPFPTTLRARNVV